jgi:hypothetical protein
MLGKGVKWCPCGAGKTLKLAVRGYRTKGTKALYLCKKCKKLYKLKQIKDYWTPKR